LSTVTYSSPVQEFYAFASAAATAGVVNVIEVRPPRGFKLIISAFEGSFGTGGVAWGILPATSITGAATTPVTLMRVSNPFQVMTGVVSIGTAAAAPGGYLYSPAFRLPFMINAVCDSVGDQRFFFSENVVNEAMSLSVKGYIVTADYETHDRVFLS